MKKLHVLLFRYIILEKGAMCLNCYVNLKSSAKKTLCDVGNPQLLLSYLCFCYTYYAINSID